MAYRAPNDDLMLDVAEQTEALREFGNRSNWRDLTPDEQTDVTLRYLSAHPEKHPDHKAAAETRPLPAPVHKCEVTWSQLDHVLTKLTKAIRDSIKSSGAAVESQFSTVLEDVLVASEAMRKQAGSTTNASELVDKVAKDLTTLRETALATMERRVTRQADHLASIESRLKALERGR